MITDQHLKFSNACMVLNFILKSTKVEYDMYFQKCIKDWGKWKSILNSLEDLHFENYR